MSESTKGEEPIVNSPETAIVGIPGNRLSSGLEMPNSEAVNGSTGVDTSWFRLRPNRNWLMTAGESSHVSETESNRFVSFESEPKPGSCVGSFDAFASWDGAAAKNHFAAIALWSLARKSTFALYWFSW